MVNWSSLGVVLALFMAGANAESLLSIQIPFELHNPDGEEHLHAHFGSQPVHHRGHLGGYVYYTDDDLCNGWNTHNKTSTYPKNKEDIQQPFILMAPTSKHCQPVVLARQAQLFGASAVVFAHQDCLCSDANCTNLHGPDCVPDVALTNDGSGGSVSIPSFLLYKESAQKVIGQLKNDQPVLMELAWGLPNKTLDAETPKFTHTLWSTANDALLDVITLQHFKTISKAVAQHGANFEPKFSIVSGERFGCDKQIENGGPCDHLCTNHGRYCALNAFHIGGQKVLNETLRRLCIWEEFGKITPETYWDYIIYHLQHCAQNFYNDESCLRDAYKHSKVDETILLSCMSDSGAITSDMQNSMFEKQLQEQRHAGIVTTPSLTVDGHILEDANSFVYFEGLCRRYFIHNWTRTPEFCYQCAACHDPIGCVQTGKCERGSVPKGLIPDDNDDVVPSTKTKKKKKTGWIWFWTISFLAGCAGCYVYYKKQQEGGSGGGVLNSYFQLSNEDPIA